MASVQELKDTVVAERERAIELAERSFQAIDTITNQANFWLTLLSVGLAILAVIGLGVIYFGSRRLARKVAHTRLDEFIKSAEATKRIQAEVEKEVRRKLDNKVFVSVQPNQIHDESKFPVDPNKSEAKDG